MTALLGAVTILASFAALFSLQLPAVIPALGYGWLRHHGPIRLTLRLAALGSFGAFLSRQPGAALLIVVAGLALSMVVASLFFTSTTLFKPLSVHHVTHGEPTAAQRASPAEVLGLVVGSEAVAYSVDELVAPHHLLNDVVSGAPVLVSFCAACGSGMVFSREVSGRPLTFELAEGLHRRNMVMRDVETGSIWQQASGRALEGPLAGAELTVMPYQVLSLSQWLTEAPSSLVATAVANAPVGFLGPRAMIRLTSFLRRHHPPQGSELVVGVLLDTDAVATPIDALTRRTFEHGSTTMEFLRAPDTGHLECREVDSRKRLPVQVHRLSTWLEFHPHSRILAKPP